MGEEADFSATAKLGYVQFLKTETFHYARLILPGPLVLVRLLENALAVHDLIFSHATSYLSS